MADDLPPLTILGVHLKSEGYPNVTYRIKALHSCTSMRIREINYSFRTDLDTGESSGCGFRVLAAPVAALRFIYAHLNVFVRYFGVDRGRMVYLPYPAVLLLLMFSLLPRALRPKVIAVDAFISVYDTVVSDRNLAREGGVVARLIWWLENRAYSVTDVVFVDTIFNAQYFKKTFSSLYDKDVVALPLSIDESFYSHAEYRANQSTCHVIFFGTFVPLQGVEIISKAAILLVDRPDIRLSLVGNGQVAGAVTEILSRYDCKNIEWITSWQSKEQIKALIDSADICLGIFGSGKKAQRVWPLKNYHYMAVGRPLITGDTDCARYLAGFANGAKPFLMVPCGDASALAEAIKALADSPESRVALAEASRQFYVSNLSAETAARRLSAILQGMAR